MGNADTVYVQLADPDFDEGSTIVLPSSTVLSIQVNPYLSENAGGTNFDSQTANEDLTYRLVSGPGSLSPSGLYTWNISYTDGGETHRLVFEVEDNGSPDNGEVRTSQDYLFVKVDLFEPEFVFNEAALAIDRDYGIAVDETITRTIWTDSGGNGVYNPIFNDEFDSNGAYNGDYAATFTLDSPSNGTVTLLNDSNGQFTYTPDPGFIGVDSFTYTIEHYSGDFNGNDVWLTSNEGVITFGVGPRYVSDLDTSVADEDENDLPGELIVWNRDDDNNNGIEDYLEINGPVQGEDDLVEITIDPFFRDDQYLLAYRVAFRVSGVRLWETADKQFEILDGAQYLEADLPGTVYAEGINGTGGSVRLQILHSGPFNDPGGIGTVTEDRVRFTAVSLDLDIDSDNDGAIQGSAWEEELEDNPYGLGKLVLQSSEPGEVKSPTLENLQDYTPVQLKLPPGLSTTDDRLKIRLDYKQNSFAGGIFLWTAPSEFEDSQFLAFGSLHTLDQLNYSSATGLITLYIDGFRESSIRTLSQLESLSKPQETIKATLVIEGQDSLSDEVKYIVSDPESIFWELQNSRQVRTGLASRGVYQRDDLPNFSLRRLSNNDLIDLQVPLAARQLLIQDSGVNGFNAVLYQDYIAGGDNQYVVAFAGTDDLLDIIDNLEQGLGRFSGQYASAITIGEELADLVLEGNIAGLVATGHSLGGGLASVASRSGGIVADTFNAAGVHANTLATIANPISVTINAYYVDWDALSLAQDNLALLPSALGTRIPMDSPYTFNGNLGDALDLLTSGVLGTLGNLLEAHKMSTVLYGLLVDEDAEIDLLGLGESPYDF